MADENLYNKLEVGSNSFQEMLKKFGIVTVMNVKVYGFNKDAFTNSTAEEALATVEATEPVCELDTLTVANLTMEGPDKTIKGGQYSNPLIKYGKSCRLEMQDALGNVDALEALCGAVVDRAAATDGAVKAIHFTEDFSGAKTIVGETFFIDQKTGAQVPVKILFPQFLPDSIANLSQSSDGDATVFDLNGDLLTTVMKVGSKDGSLIQHGVFYSILDGSK